MPPCFSFIKWCWAATHYTWLCKDWVSQYEWRIEPGKQKTLGAGCYFNCYVLCYSEEPFCFTWMRNSPKENPSRRTNMMIAKKLFFIVLWILSISIWGGVIPFLLDYNCFTGFPCGSAGKESACNAGDLGLIPGLGRFPGEGKGYPLQYSGLENSMDCTVHRVAKSRTQLSDTQSHYNCFTMLC